ncbi:MAG: DUF2909 family protein [Gammaproteobacteria bacterium AqS3]|nr:DUF2909 family protein [Gammaproteobacteria bacterium AqS3]
MLLRAVIILLLLGVLATLFMSALHIFSKDGNRKRAMALLGVRVIIAAVLLVVVVWGLITGNLSFGAPWS